MASSNRIRYTSCGRLRVLGLKHLSSASVFECLLIICIAIRWVQTSWHVVAIHRDREELGKRVFLDIVTGYQVLWELDLAGA